MLQIYPPLSYVHYIANSFSYQHETSYSVQYEQQRPWAAQVVHTHRKSYWSGWPRGSGELNTETKCIFTSASVGSSRRSYSFTSASVRIRAVPQVGESYPICDDPLSRSARYSFAPGILLSSPSLAF